MRTSFDDNKENYLPGGMVVFSGKNVFPLGQDSILLGHFASPPKHAKVLDLGCGCGVLSFLLTGRDETLDLTAVDLSEEAIALVRQTAAYNKAEDKVRTIHGDLRGIKALFPHGSFDYVICNPPYFATGSGKAHHALSNARQEETATLKEVCAAAAYALKHRGKCAMVFRPERLQEFLCCLSEASLAVKRLRFVHQRANKTPSAVLIEAVKGGKNGMQVCAPLIIEDANGQQSNEYKKIYNIYK